MSHLPPFFCPYCGDEELRPYGERHGEWLCGSCRRAFALRAVKQAADQQAADQQAADQQAADRQASDRQASDRQASDQQSVGAGASTEEVAR